jgi:hypothetical protein
METSPAFVAHEQRSGHEEAYKNFIANTKLHIWALNDGVRFFGGKRWRAALRR